MTAVRRAIHGNRQYIYGHARVYYLREGERRFIFHLWPLQLDRIIITAAAALDPKADLGLAILPNPLVGIAAICAMAGFATGPWSWE